MNTKRLFAAFFALLLAGFALGAQSVQTQRPIRFAVLSDTHLGSFAYALDDLNRAIDDINADSSIEFVIISGDITEFGTDSEIEGTRQVLSRLGKKYLFVPGNHDTNWSESGCTTFNKVMGGSQFRYLHHGVLFLGIGSGPYMRMGPCQAPREDIEWLRANLEATDPDTPVVFVIHSPLTQDAIANSDQIIDLLKTRNIQFVISGHYHLNRAVNYEGIPGVIVRSNLRRNDPCGGYTVVTLDKGRVDFAERRPCEDTLRAPWAGFELKKYDRQADTIRPVRQDYTRENAEHSRARVVWEYQDEADIASGTAYDKGTIYLTNTLGQVKALRARDGRVLWTFRTGEKIFSEPTLYRGRLYVSSADGSVYCLNAKNGKKIWQYATDYPILSTPLVTDDGYVYVGGAKGKFYALDARTGAERWVYQGIKGYTEARPVVWQDKVYIGSWGAEFYAFDRFRGTLVWKFAPGKSRFFSPGGCWPVAYQGKIFVHSADWHLYCFDAESGKILWSTREAGGRESIGLSQDGKTLYVKSVKDKVVAIDTQADVYAPLWTTDCGFGGEYGPTRITATARYIFVSTATGKVYCLERESGRVAWHHRFSSSLITSAHPVGDHTLIVTTMGGKVFYLEYDK